MSGKTDDDLSQLVDNDQLNRDLQPHLAVDTADSEGSTALEYVNPVVDDSDSAADRTGNADSGNNEPVVGKDNSGSRDANDGSNSGQNGGLTSSTPVVYNAGSGESSVVREPVVIRQPNGIHVIRTRECCPRDINRIRVYERPLTQKKIRLLKAFSTVATVLFFPLGIPALYYAFKCEKEFDAGILRGNIDLAQKMAKRSERLIIFSVMATLLVVVAVFAIIERKLVGDDEDYWRQRSHSGAFPTG